MIHAGKWIWLIYLLIFYFSLVQRLAHLQYIHRIGRTGRGGNLGVATSFFDAMTNTGLAGSLLGVHVYCFFLAEHTVECRSDRLKDQNLAYSLSLYPLTLSC